VGLCQYIFVDLFVGGDPFPSMTRQAAGVVDFAGIDPKQMLTELARMSGMLSGKMILLVEAIDLHEEP
jgi:hypothetical protein